MIYQPHNYQSYCTERILCDKAIGLFLDMGLGKTVITLTAINELKYNRFEVSKALVIAPKKVAETTWAGEAKKWDHLRLLRVEKVLGSAKQRIKALNTPADVYVINRDNVAWLAEYYRNCWPFDTVVVDELSSFKNHRAKRFKSLTWVRRSINRIVGLTGTPAPNGLIDLWAQVYLLDGGRRLGRYITHFRERYFEPDQRGGGTVYNYKPKQEAERAIHSLIGDICISLRAEDYLSLPAQIKNIVSVELDVKARKMYSKLERDMLLCVDESVIDAGSAAVLTNKLLQLCNGAAYAEGRNFVELHNCKLEAFLELVEGLNGQPALVYYYFQHDLFRLEKALQATNLRFRKLTTPEDERAWNAREIDILLAHPASAAYGLNLQSGGNHVIWFGLNWSLELYLQANARLHRQGQNQTVIIHHLVVKGSRDEDVMDALENKENTQELLLQSLKARVEKYKKGGFI